jgi:hypothetical protein
VYFSASVEICGLQGREDSVCTGINTVITLQVRISEVQASVDAMC